MKKAFLLIAVMFLCVGAFGQSTDINVGTSANDGTGDNLRAAGLVINANNQEIRDSISDLRTTLAPLFNPSLVDPDLNDASAITLNGHSISINTGTIVTNMDIKDSLVLIKSQIADMQTRLDYLESAINSIRPPYSPSVSAGYDATVSAGDAYTLSYSDSIYCDSINWASTGTGTFDNHELLHPVYTPSAADVTAGSVSLIITGYYPVGQTDSDTMLLTIRTGHTYYIKTGGDDSNTGLSDAQAWAHHPWMNTWTGTTVLSEGDSVLMNKGDVWTHSGTGYFMTVANNGTSGNPIVTSSYGTGARPLVEVSVNTGSAVIYALGKSYIVFDGIEVRHYSPTYSSSNNFGIYGSSSGSSVCHDWTIKNCEIDSIPHSAIIFFPNCYNITVGDVTATSTATTEVYSNHIHDFGYSGVQLQGVNPSTLISDNFIYKNYIHDATRTTAGDNEYGLYFTASSGSSAWPKYCYARYNNVQNIETWEGIDIHSGAYIYLCQNYVYNFGSVAIHTASTTMSGKTTLYDHIYIDSNIVEQPATGWVTGRENAFILHFDSEDAISHNIYIRNNTIFYTSRPTTATFSGIRMGNVDTMYVSGNHFYNGATGSSVSAINISANYATHGNKVVRIYNNFIEDWVRGFNIDATTITGQVTLDHNIISKASYGIYMLNGDIPSGGELRLFNNDIIGTGSYGIYSANGVATGGTLTASNNIIGRTTSASHYYWYLGGTIGGTFNCDYNQYWNASASYFYLGGAKSLAQWVAAGYEAHTPNSTESLSPQFTNAGGSYSLDTDFGLGAASPSLNVGVSTGITLDYFGNGLNSTIDLGAIERQ